MFPKNMPDVLMESLLYKRAHKPRQIQFNL